MSYVILKENDDLVLAFLSEQRIQQLMISLQEELNKRKWDHVQLEEVGAATQSTVEPIED